MTDTLYTDAPEVQAVARRAFPGYSGRKFRLRVIPDDATVDITSHWDGGSRDRFRFVSLNGANSQAFQAPQSGTPFDGELQAGAETRLPPQVVCVE